ncbi:MAG: hypothetical protein ACI9I0_000711, partial [Rhodoferax sp.]
VNAGKPVSRLIALRPKVARYLQVNFIWGLSGQRARGT